MSKSGISYGRLTVVAHIQSVDTSEMHKGGIFDGSLIATSHFEGVDTLQKEGQKRYP